MAISSGVKVSKLTVQERAASGFTHACVVPYSTIVSVGAANTTANVAIFDARVGDVVCDCAMAITAAFTDSDASLNSIDLIVGDDGDTDRFMPATTTELAEDGTEVDYFWALAGGAPATSTMPFAYVTANTVDALFTVAGGANPTCAELTSGSVTIFLKVVNLADLASGIINN
jgi:hypothetical protein